jgi:hypothetical protein
MSTDFSGTVFSGTGNVYDFDAEIEYPVSVFRRVMLVPGRMQVKAKASSGARLSCGGSSYRLRGAEDSKPDADEVEFSSAWSLEPNH